MNYRKKFINNKLRLSNVDNYYVRESIFLALQKVLPNMKGDFFDLGCGSMPYKDFILENNNNVKSYTSCDIVNEYYNNSPDIIWDGEKIPCKDNSYDTIISTEVYEHCFDIDLILNETYRVLRDNGIVFFTVPFVWVLHDQPYDYYRYTPYALYKKIKSAGFRICEIHSLGGWEAVLGTVLGLYSRRKPGNNKIKEIKSLMCYPILKLLYSKSLKKLKQKSIKFDDNISLNEKTSLTTISTGYFGIAVK